MIDTTSWIIFITTALIYLVFLFYDAFGRDEPYGNLAYIVAAIPSTYLWYLVTFPSHAAEYANFGTTGAWTFLVGLWLVAMVRDLIIVRKGKKDIDDVGLYLVIGIIVQLIVSAVVPSDGVLPSMQSGAQLNWFFWLPDIVTAAAEAALALNMLRILTTVLTILFIIPLILDLRGEPVNMWVLVLVTAIFSLPLALISWLWLPEGWIALLFLELVLLFVVLLLLTRGSEQKKTINIKK